MRKQRTSSLIDNRLIIAIFSVAIVIVMGLGVTFAWLTDRYNKKGDTTIGQVGIEIYSGTTKLNGTLDADGNYTVGQPLKVEFGALNTKKTVDISIKNTGTIPGIVRCFIAITTDEGPHDHYTDLDGAKYVVKTNQMSITQNNWVTLYDDELINDCYYFNSFLNEQIPANTSKSIISDMTPIADGLNNTSVYVYIRAEIVAYSGNAYQVDTVDNPVADIDKPFGVLTTDFLNTWTAWR